MSRLRSLAVLLGLVLAGEGCAATTLEWVKHRGTLTLGYRESSIPFSFAGPSGPPAGYSIDLCTRIAAAVKTQLGLPTLSVRWVRVTPEDRVKAVVDGTIDLECGSTTHTLARQAEVDFSQMIFVDGGSLLTTRTAGIRRLADLADRRVALIPATTTATTLTAALDRAGVRPQLVPVPDHAQGLAALEAGRADAYASDQVVLIGLALTAPAPDRFALVDELYSYEPYALMLRRGDADFRLLVDRELARLYRSGEIFRIYERWFGPLGGPATLLGAMYLLHGLPE